MESLIENTVARFPAVFFGLLHSIHLERNEITGLKQHSNKFNKIIYISGKTRYEIFWYINNIDKACHHIVAPNPDITMNTDACLSGWSITDGKKHPRELWHRNDVEHIINVLKLKTIDISIHTYSTNKDLCHVHNMYDNTTIISYINNMGGIKSEYNDKAYMILDFCISEKLGISSVYILVTDKKKGKQQSRVLEDTTE